MKAFKILTTIIALFAFVEAEAQYVAVYKKNGSVKQYSMEEVDSLVFYEKEQVITPNNPNEGHGSENYTDVAVTGGTSNVDYSSVTITCYANIPTDGETYVIGIRYSTEHEMTDKNSSITKKIVTNASKGNASVTFDLKELDNALTYYYQTFVQLYSNQKYYYGETLSFAPKAIHLTIGEAIDMGVSVKWASTNLGADQPEQDGGYFAFGEIEEKDRYSTDNYKYYDNSTYEFLSLGENISGNPYFDAATAKLGGKWRIPTYQEFMELRNNSKTAIVTYKGRKGFIVESTLNGNTIFMPYNGVKYENETRDYNTLGSYWTATYGRLPQYDGDINHWEISYYGFGNSFILMNSQGLGIRPVTE